MSDGSSPAQLIDRKIAALGDWRGAMLARLRQLIRQADPQVVESVKWIRPSNPSVACSRKTGSRVAWARAAKASVAPT